MKYIKCINTGGIEELTLNKKYKVVAEDMEWYRIMNDNGMKDGYQKHLFEIIGKEVKECDFRTVIREIKPEEEYRCQDFIVRCLSDNTIEIIAPSDNTIGFCSSDSFIKVEKVADFITAWKSLEEGKEIESVCTHNRYKKDNRMLLIVVEGFGFEECDSISSEEILDDWIIIE